MVPIRCQPDRMDVWPISAHPLAPDRQTAAAFLSLPPAL